MGKKILLIATGGTIASTEEGMGLEPTLDVKEVLRYLPQLPEDCMVDGVELFALDSTNIGKKEWTRIAACIEENYDAYDGFVIVHGTDTMAYTSSALSYMIQGGRKAILLTGAQHPLVEEGSDGPGNLYDAICAALDDELAGVYVVFDGDIILGTRAKKVKAYDVHSMESINYPVIAVMEGGKLVWKQKPEETHKEVAFFKTAIPSIHVVHLTPFTKPELMEFVFYNYDYVVLEGYGAGNIPDSLWEDIAFLSRRYESMVVVATQVLREGTNCSLYAVGQRLLELPQVVEAKDMTIEAIVTKLMWIQGQEVSRMEDRIQLFDIPIHLDRRR